MNTERTKIQNLVKLALFSGIIIVLASTPLGFVPLGVIKATTVHIPVIIGSILLGWKQGAFLGGLFGLTSLVVNTLTPNLTSFVFTPAYSLGDIHGNLWSLVVCFVPRILTGIIPYFVFKALKKITEKDGPSLALAGFAGSMTNTLFVMHFIYFFFGSQWGQAKGIAEDLVYKTILVVIATNGIPEAIVASLAVLAIGKALIKVAGRKRRI